MRVLKATDPPVPVSSAYVELSTRAYYDVLAKPATVEAVPAATKTDRKLVFLGASETEHFRRAAMTIKPDNFFAWSEAAILNPHVRTHSKLVPWSMTNATSVDAELYYESDEMLLKAGYSKDKPTSTMPSFLLRQLDTQRKMEEHEENYRRLEFYFLN